MLKRGNPSSSLAHVALLIYLCACVVATCACSSRGATKTTLVRGELDRTHWTLRVCSSGEVVRVIFPSAVFGHYDTLEDQANIGPADPVMADFEVIPVTSTSSGLRSVGVMKVLKVEAGRCSGAS